MNDKNPYILVLGASIVDIFGFCGRSYAQRDSIPGHIKISFGGVCRNIAENLARVGVETKFISTLGDDENGKSIFEHSKKLGYSMEHSLFLKNESTPTYMAILNHQGEMESAVVDMESLNKMDESFAKFNELLTQDPQNSYALYYRGMIYDTKEKRNEAIADLKKAYSLNKDFTICNYLIASDYDALGKYKDAYNYYTSYANSQAEDDEYKQYAKARAEELKQYATTTTTKK